MKLALGTVQFGMDYGISNKDGKVLPDEVGKILEYAQEQGINILDTAQDYGNSEKILSNFDLSEFKIITKIIGNNILEKSLENLNQKSVYGLMLHREDEINDKIWDVFERYKAQKMVEKIGVSIYSPAKLLQIIEKYPIDIVQIPLNVLDQRFLPILPKLKDKNIEIHTRSTFLQGLLLMETNKINPYFSPILPVLKKLPENKLKIVLNFVNSIKEVDKILIGVTSLTELRQIVNAIGEIDESIDFDSFIIEDEKFILPQNWRLQNE